MKIRLQNFRNHGDMTLEFSPGVTFITGLNGSGKTSIVEAIYLLLQGKSWRGTVKDIQNDQNNWFRVDLDKRIFKYQNQEKTFEIDGKITKTLPRTKKQQIILFEPENTRILYGSPTRRREFIDYFLGQINEKYAENLRKYNRILKQRNNLLKQEYSENHDFEIWNIGLAETGSEIIQARRKWVAEINKYLIENYQKTVKTTDKVVIKYQNCDTYSDLLQQFTKNLAKEKIVGHTIAGPHKDDILFLINNKPAAKTVSRGEGKILLLTIFIILIKKYSVRYVIFDDLFNEIDIKKIHKIEKLLEGIPNVFITDCRLTELDISSNIIKL